jgi:hypothetical protein
MLTEKATQYKLRGLFAFGMYYKCYLIENSPVKP